MKIEIDASGADVVKFPKWHKPPPDGALMLVKRPQTCIHFGTQFEVDTENYRCRCLGCGEEVSPYVVLQRLMQHESRWMQAREAYQADMKRLTERSRTKCQHCGEMTRISTR